MYVCMYVCTINLPFRFLGLRKCAETLLHLIKYFIIIIIIAIIIIILRLFSPISYYVVFSW